jgi:hypothetical protein
MMFLILRQRGKPVAINFDNVTYVKEGMMGTDESDCTRIYLAGIADGNGNQTYLVVDESMPEVLGGLATGGELPKPAEPEQKPKESDNPWQNPPKKPWKKPEGPPPPF